MGIVGWVGHAPENVSCHMACGTEARRAKRMLEFTWSTCLGDEWRESYWIVCVHVSEYMAMRLLRISSHIYVQSTARITQQTLRGIPPRRTREWRPTLPRADCGRVTLLSFSEISSIIPGPLQPPCVRDKRY